jgi:hypothetical protein
MTVVVLLLLLGANAPQVDTFKIDGAAVCPSIPAGLVVPKGIPAAAKFYERRILMHLHEAWGLGRAAIVFAQIHQESGFDCRAVSQKGAAGLAQFMPSTAVLMQKNSEYLKQLMKFCSDVKGCPFSPDWALRAMALLDKENYQRYRQPTGDERYAFMLADYNGGNVALRAEIRLCASLPFCDSTKYFGHVREKCGSGLAPGSTPGQQPLPHVTRTDKDCKENTEYPRAILRDLRPRYAVWLLPGL